MPTGFEIRCPFWAWAIVNRMFLQATAGDFRYLPMVTTGD
jgi:hypothetical protein